MTPRDFDADVVQSRLRVMTELLDDLTNTGEIDHKRLEADRLLRHAVERILSQLVEMAVSTNTHVAATVLGEAPTTYKSSFALAAKAGLIDADLAARLEPSVGLRNVSAHEYVNVDLVIVAGAAEPARRDYGSYVTAASRWLAAR